MGTAIITERIEEASPRSKARAAGFFWLMTILTGMFAFLIGGSFVVPGDAATTAANIMAHEPLYRWAFVSNLIATVCYLVATLFIYVLLKPVNRNISLLGAFFSLTGCASGGVSCLLYLAPIGILSGAKYLSVFSVEQLQALALTFVTLSLQVSDIGLVFFGLQCLSVGYLIRRSTFLPRILGVLLAITGLCYLTNSLANFLSLPFKAYLLPFVAAGGLLGEGSLSLWLLVKGVNVQRWKEQASLGI